MGDGHADEMTGVVVVVVVVVAGQRVVVQDVDAATGTRIALALPIEATTSFAARGEIRMGASPQLAVVGDGAPEVMNVLAGRIVAAEFRGTAHEVAVALDGGAEITVLLPGQAARAAMLSPGQPITLAWPASSFVALEAEAP